MDPALNDSVTAIYRGLYPSGNFAIPAMQIGGVGFRDQYYIARVNVGFGRFAVKFLECIDIDRSELSELYRLHPNEVNRSAYCVADLWDFAYGALSVRGKNSEADKLWENAGSSIEAGARLLASGGPASDAAVQSACLAAELGLKGALAQLGVPEARRRKLSHHLSALVDELKTLVTLTSTARLRSAVAVFPDYAKTRYDEHGLSRVQLVELMMRSQYIAAESVRLISKRDAAQELEESGQLPRRDFP